MNPMNQRFDAVPSRGARARPAVLLAFLALAACKRSGSDFEVQAAIHEDIVTVVELSWTTEQAGTSWVEYGIDGAYDMSTPQTDEADTEHEFLLLGLPALTEVSWRAHTEVDGEDLTTEGTITTGNLPSSLPDLEVTDYEADQVDDWKYLMGAVLGSPAYIFVIDREGNWLWYLELENTLVSSGPLYSDVMFKDGTNHLLFNQFSTDLDRTDLAYVTEVDFSGEVIQTWDTPSSHHAFLELPDGKLAYTAGDVREWYNDTTRQTDTVVGDAIVEVSDDGTTETVFSTWDWREPAMNQGWDYSIYAQGADWTHANGLYYYPDTDTYLISLGFVDTILEVSRSDGTVTREFSRRGDVWTTEESTDFSFQHDAHWTEEDTLIMVSTQNDTDETIGIEYTLDEEAGNLEEVWSYHGDVYSAAEGQVRRLDNGNTLMNWGFVGICREVTPEDETVWEVNLDVGATMVRVRTFSDFYARE